MFTGGADVTPDQFDWYCYQGRAFGIHVDLNSGSFCSGKMLLGSYMKKPLWVDHSATTVGSLSDTSLRFLFHTAVAVTHLSFLLFHSRFTGFSPGNKLGERGHQRQWVSLPSSAGVCGAVW